MSKYITCDTVRDLLPLYQEQVLQSDVRENVEEHLEDCATCRELYLPDEEEEHLPVLKKNAPSNLDQAIMAEISAARRKRVKTIIATALAANILTGLLVWIPAYIRSRENMAYHMNNFATGLTWMNYSLDGKQEIPGFFFEVTAGAILTETTRWERMVSKNRSQPPVSKSYGAMQFSEHAPVMELYRYLILRSKWGGLTEEEQQLKSQFSAGINELESLLEREQERLTTSFPLLRLMPVPIYQIEQKIHDLNYLSSFYLRYSALPGSIETLDSSVLLSKTAELLSLDEDYDLWVVPGASSYPDIFKASDLLPSVLTTIRVSKAGSAVANVTFDNYTGKVLSISLKTGQLMEEEEIMDLALELFNNNYGNDYSLSCTTEVNPLFTSIKATLLYHGIQVSSGSISGHFQRDSKELYLYFGYIPALDGVVTQPKVSVDQAMAKLPLADPDNLVYADLILIPSAASNSYVLAHRFIEEGYPHYVNALTGNLEVDIRYHIRSHH